MRITKQGFQLRGVPDRDARLQVEATHGSRDTAYPHRLQPRSRLTLFGLIAGLLIAALVLVLVLTGRHPTSSGGAVTPARSDSLTTSPATARNSLVVTKLGSATGDASFYNTFGPWDQHVVYDGAYGVFAVYHTTENEEQDPGCHCGYFRVVRSLDGGSTWTTVYDSQTDGTLVQDPAIDKDASGNIYVTGNVYNASVGGGWQTNIWRFRAGSFSSTPQHTLVNYGSSKYSMIYDPARNQIDLGLWLWGSRPNFVAINASTLSVVKTVNLFKLRTPNYDDAEYPNLAIGPSGQVLFGWSTVDAVLWNNGAGTQNYYDAHFLVTTDGGATWDGPNGQVTLPIYGSDSNSYEVVNAQDPAEFEPYGSSSYKGNWNMLDTLLWNDNGVDAAYMGYIPQNHVSFARLDWASQTWMNRSHSQVTAEGDKMNADSEGLSENPSYTGAIYRMGQENAPGGGTRVRADVSTDDGATWHTFATSSWSTDLGWDYLDPSHVVGPKGQLGAVFTVITSSTSSDVYFVHSQ